MARCSCALILLQALFLPACGGGGGDDDQSPVGKEARVVGRVAFENESNEIPEEATNVVPGLAAAGDLTDPNDVDLWRFEANAGDVFRVTLHGTRLGFEAWNSAGNVPLLQLLAADGDTVLQTHSLDVGWSHGVHDMDFPFILIKQSGAHFLRLTAYEPGLPGGPYAFELERLVLPNPQVEGEIPGTTGANDGPVIAQVITAGTVVAHTSDGDEDWYEIRVAAGDGSDLERLRFEVTGYRNGILEGAADYADLRLELFDSDGTTLLASDTGSFFDDPALGYLVLALAQPRTLFLRVLGIADDFPVPYFIDFDRRRENNPGLEGPDGTDNSIAYGEIVLAELTADANDFYRFEGQAGDMVRLWVWHQPNFHAATERLETVVPFFDCPFDLTFDRTGQTFDVVRFILPESRTIGIGVAQLPAGTDATAYALELELVSRAAFETESNDTLATASPVDAGGRAAGQIEDPGDQDLFRFQASEGDLVKVLVFARDANSVASPASAGFEVFDGHGSRLAPEIDIADEDNTPVAFAPFAFRPEARVSTESIVDGLATMGVSFIAPRTGTFFALLRSADGEAGPEHVYQIQVSGTSP